MAQLLTVRLNKSDQQPLGFRLQGGKDFGTPLVVQKVNGGSAAERAGLQAGDALIRVNNTEVFTLRHQEAQDAIRAAGAALELTVQRGGGTWRPSVTPTGSLPRPGSRLGGTPTPVTQTSLKANQQPSKPFGSGHNNVAKPFSYMNGNEAVKSIVNKQYNTPVNMYSEQTIAETLSAQTEVLAGGVLGVNFKKNEKTYDAEKSAVYKVLQEEQNDPEPVEPTKAAVVAPVAPASGLRHVAAPTPRPDAPLNNTGGLPPGQNICEECERLITGVFVRIKDKNLHVECFKCSTCGSSLKNQGYYNLNGKLYCDIHAKLVARQNPPGPNLDPVTVPPGGRLPTNSYSTPLPPLATNNYTNGSSSMFSPSSNISGPKPFGSSLGSAYSPSLSPRSAPLSPAARPVTAPAPLSPAARPVTAPAPAPPAAAPFAPTNEAQTFLKTEFKSPAEERLIRKMAKMALNGYEIGIQRKIKPADHIQSMANQIQDTVVSKHPLNSDSDDINRESITHVSKSKDKGYKTMEDISSIGNKIKDIIVNKHPANIHSSNGNVLQSINNKNIEPMDVNYSANNNYNNKNIPPPPPIPTSPLPVYNNHSKPIVPSMNNFSKKDQNYMTKNLFNKNSEGSLLDHIDKEGSEEKGIDKIYNYHNGSGYSSNDESSKDKEIGYNYLNTLKKKNDLENRHPLNGNESSKSNKVEDKCDNCHSNTLSKINLFEKSDSHIFSNRFLNQSTKYDTLENNCNKSINSTRSAIIETDSKTSEVEKKNNLTVNLHDNSLYTPRTPKPNTKEINNFNKDHLTSNNYSENYIKKVESAKKIDDESETVVKRREKKIDRNNEGKRDSHIITRPQSTMTSVDVADGLYPVCHICDKSITRGPFITALGRIWCPDHFMCVNATCKRPLQDIGFVEENGQLYCEYCFEQYIAPACDKCHAKIKGDCLNAIGKHFHPECFSCVYCGKLFGNNPFFLEDGLPYCEADWNELFTTKCFACGFPVEAGDRWVEALNNNYHSQCFNCTVCKKNLEGQSFFAKGGRPFCKLHAR